MDIESVLKEQAKRVLKDPYDTLLKTWRGLARDVEGSLFEVPFIPARDDVPPGYNEAQAKIGEWIRSVQITVNYKGYRIELRSIAPVITEKLYTVSFKVKYEATKEFYLALARKSWAIPGAFDFVLSCAKQILPDMNQKDKETLALLKKEFSYPAVRTGSLEVDGAFHVRGDNAFLAAQSFASWKVREVFADPGTPFKCLIIRGSGFQPESENSLVLSGAVDPAKTDWLRRGFDVIGAELDVLGQLGLIKNAVAEQTPGQ